jgi:hypothetical protein
MRVLDHALSSSGLARRRRMKQGLKGGLGLVAIIAAVGVSSAGATTAPATTAPAITVSVKVAITDTQATLSPKSAKRGYFAYFRIRNLGKKPHRIVIGGLTSRVIAPGERALLGANLEERGRYQYKVDRGGRRGYVGYFSVI